MKYPFQKKISQDVINLVKNTKAAILPFTETPAENRNTGMTDKASINAADLFSFFTASIIKEDVVFVR